MMSGFFRTRRGRWIGWILAGLLLFLGTATGTINAMVNHNNPMIVVCSGLLISFSLTFAWWLLEHTDLHIVYEMK